MAKKSNRVNVTIAYSKELLNRDSVAAEFHLVLELNALLDKHRALSCHHDPIAPTVTAMDTDPASGIGNYGCKIQLNFSVTHSGGQLYHYTRLHYLLYEIASLVERHSSSFDRMETTLDLDGMVQPWALVSGQQSMLLRKGAAQWNATDYLIPGFCNLHQATDGLCVMGEPRAVEDFRKIWTFYANKWATSNDSNELQELDERGVHYGASININDMMRDHPTLQWQHLLIWVHAINVPGDEGWYVVNLDSTDPWLVAGVKYTSIYSESLTNAPMPFGFRSQTSQTKFFPDMEHISLSTQSE